MQRYFDIADGSLADGSLADGNTDFTGNDLHIDTGIPPSNDASQFAFRAEHKSHGRQKNSVLLSEEEERSAVLCMRGGNSHARDALVTAHIGLVKHIAKTHRSHLIGYDDLVQEGTIGLIYAVDRFDPDRGCRL